MQHLPLFKTTFDYTSLVTEMLEGMPKKYRFSIGESLFKSALNMFNHISYANRMRGEQRKVHLESFIAEYDVSKALIRLCNEKKILTIKQVANLTLKIESMSKQAQGWKNS